jgi:predicted dehydrogenase
VNHKVDLVHIGLIGCGRWGQYILRDLHTLGCSVTVLARSENSRQRAMQLSAARIVSKLKELPVVDGFVVATPTATHAEMLEHLIPIGVPIFVEKPLSADVFSAEKIAQTTDQVFVMDKWRYHPGVRMLAEIARSGELGETLGLRTFRLGWGNPHTDVDAIWILAPHDLSIALEILGFIPEPKAAIAAVTSEPAYLLALLGEHPWLALEVSARSTRHHRAVELHGRFGMATLSDGYDDHVLVTRNDDSPSTQPEKRFLENTLPLIAELEAFITHLRGGPAPRSSTAEGVLVVQTIARLRALAGLDQPLEVLNPS